jgi:Tfp pilus assembly protein PilW
MNIDADNLIWDIYQVNMLTENINPSGMIQRQQQQNNTIFAPLTRVSQALIQILNSPSLIQSDPSNKATFDQIKSRLSALLESPELRAVYVSGTSNPANVRNLVNRLTALISPEYIKKWMALPALSNNRELPQLLQIVQQILQLR